METIKKDDKILVRRPEASERQKYGIIWREDMEQFVGKEFTVEYVDAVGHIKIAEFNLLWLHPDWCEKVK